MDKQIEKLLRSVQQGETTIEDAYDQLRGYDDLGFAKVDLQRSKRKGFAEVIYGEGKTAQQIILIFEKLMTHSNQVLATRVSADKARLIVEQIPDALYNEIARTISWRKHVQQDFLPGYVAVVCAGTSDLPIAEEACETLQSMNCQVTRVYDVGVAGIHRLLDKLPKIVEADVVIVIAGMEGALASVVGGLVAKPIIAVPTSIGYGTSFGGVSALLTMLNSCASGVSVVNIDNGFGAAYCAATIMKNKGV